MGSPGGTTGTIKSYNGLKGFGFITADGVSGDVMFTRQVLPSDALSVHGKFLEGRQVAFVLEQKPDGRLGANSLQIPAVEGKELMGSVKNFSDRNGYGFITSSAVDGKDIRFTTGDLPYAVSKEAITGALVLFSMQVLPDGKLRATNLSFQTDGQTASAAKGGAKGFAPPQWAAPPSYGKGVPPGYGKGDPYGKGAWEGGYGKGAWEGAYGKGYDAWDGGFGGPPGYGKGAPPSYGYGKGPPPSYGYGKGAPPAASFGKGAPPTAALASDAIGGTMQGHVKTYSDRNGYGFINVPGTAGDIKFGKGDLVGVETVASGTPVSFTASASPDGRVRAEEVTIGQGGVKRMTNGPAGGPQKLQRVMPSAAPEVTPGEQQTGIVRTYNPMKGFGFISVEGLQGDVYLGKTALPVESQTLELTGATVSFEIAVSADGSGKLRAMNAFVMDAL